MRTNRGRILVDGVDIATVPLNRLRSSIAVVPQDPSVFSGTIRSNLDMAGVHSDASLWRALSVSGLHSAVSQLPSALDTPVASDGAGLSVGQKQLLCFARAAVKDASIVVMDEATASVDPETDAAITRGSMEIFAGRTVFIIAHRLQTILKCDRVMVMEHGHIAEFDSPSALRANQNSAFNKLLASLS